MTPLKCLFLHDSLNGIDHLFGVDIRLHLVPNPHNYAFWVDPERNTMNAIKSFSHELLGASDTIGLHDLL